jgi:hypothetical protein
VKFNIRSRCFVALTKPLPVRLTLLPFLLGCPSAWGFSIQSLRTFADNFHRLCMENAGDTSWVVKLAVCACPLMYRGVWPKVWGCLPMTSWRQSLSVRVFVLCRLRLDVSRNREATTISGAWSKLASAGYLHWSQTTVVIPTVGVIRLNLQACVYLCVCVSAQSHALINTSTIARREGSYTHHHQLAVHAQRAPVTSRRFDKL